MKKRKKIAFSILILSISFTVLISGASAVGISKWNLIPASTAPVNVTARFVVASDAHMGQDNADKKLSHALEEMYKAAPNLNAVVFAGDVTNSGDLSQYDTLMNILRDKLKSNTQLEITMGNHEYMNVLSSQENVENFSEKTGCELNTNMVVGADAATGNTGYHIIGISADGPDGDYTKDYEWLKQQLEEAAAEDPNKPIFLVSHHGIQNTAYLTDEWYGNFGKIESLLEKYPQVIHFAGHSHASLNDPRSIYEDKFTEVQTATLSSYFELEQGKMEGTCPEESETASQALMLEVTEDNIVTIRRMDMTSVQYIGEPWIINIPEVVKDTDKFSYTTEKRTAVSSIPTFPEYADVKVNHVTQNSVNITFAQGLNQEGYQENGVGNDDGFIQSYRIIIKDTQGNEICNKLTFSDFCKIPMSIKLTKEVTKIALEPSTTYQIQIFAINPFQKESETWLETSFTTPSEFTG